MSDHRGSLIRDLKEHADVLHNQAYELENIAELLQAERDEKEAKNKIQELKERAKEYLR